MKTKILAIISGIWADIKDTYQRSKIFILGVLTLIIALEFNNLWAAFQVYLASKQLKQTETKDQTLATQEDTDNKQAATLIQEANGLPAKEGQVRPDWYKKGQK